MTNEPLSGEAKAAWVAYTAALLKTGAIDPALFAELRRRVALIPRADKAAFQEWAESIRAELGRALMDVTTELVTGGGERLTETTQSESSAADVGACVPCGGTGKVVRGLPCPNCGATGRCGHSMRQPNGFCECGHADKSGSSK